MSRKVLIHKVDLKSMLTSKYRDRIAGTCDYTRNSYCSRCAEKKPIELIFCDECGRRVRHRPTHTKGKVWDSILKRM
jgi:hypothetical protein